LDQQLIGTNSLDGLAELMRSQQIKARAVKKVKNGTGLIAALSAKVNREHV
jgi:hypothetical protein